MQSAPERPGAVEVAFLLRGDDDEDDLVGLRCYASAHRDETLLRGFSKVMMHCNRIS